MTRAQNVMPIRCLVVDDQPEFLEAVRHLLDGQGISVVGVAANSAEAIERAANLQPDVVLIDVHLGEESGLEVASRIAALDQAGCTARDTDLDLSEGRPGRGAADGIDDRVRVKNRPLGNHDPNCVGLDT